MTMGKTQRLSQSGLRIVAAALVLAGGLAVSACSSDDPDSAAARADTAPGDFPDVNTVPETKPANPSPEELESVAQGLVADAQGRRYLNEGTRRAPTEISAPPSAAPAPGTVPPPPAPSVAPSPVSPAATPETVATAAPSAEPAVPPMARTTVTPVAPGQAAPSPAVPRMAAAAPMAGPGTLVIDSSGARTEQVASLRPTGAVDAAAAANGYRSLDDYDPRGVRVSSKVGVIYFSNASSGLDGNDMTVIREIAAYHRQYGGTLRVVGHASSRTADMSPTQHMTANLEMSAQRADTVARALIASGVPAGQIFVGAVSDEQKIYREVMPSGEAHNRRAEVYLDY